MNYNISLSNELSGRSGKGNNKKSVKNSKEKINLVKETKDITISNRVAKTINTTNETITSAGMNIVSGSVAKMFGGAVVAIAAVANKGHDVSLAHRSAVTGDSVYYDNIKASKNMILSLGTNIMLGGVSNELYAKQVIKRQNQALSYGRELYNLQNYGEKYKVR